MPWPMATELPRHAEGDVRGSTLNTFVESLSASAEQLTLLLRQWVNQRNTWDEPKRARRAGPRARRRSGTMCAKNGGRTRPLGELAGERVLEAESRAPPA